ncbi:MAG: hypothetical protein JST51_07750 [Armatimonadetes bacterium]|nr:hypothetical protein [Armatimonadota bacterium]
MSKFRINKNLLAIALFSVFAASAHADWGQLCSGPSPRTSADFGFQFIETPLFGAFMGVSGTYSYNDGNATPPGCFSTAITGNAAGRIGFGAGTTGTIQTTLDDDMGFTWGWHFGVVGSSGYAIIREDDTPSLFGVNAFQTSFTGASDTYFYGRTTNGNVQIDLRCDLVADSARLQWTLTNIDTVSHNIALGFGQTVALLSDTTVDSRGTGPSLSGLGTYVTVPGIKPPRTERRWTRTTDPSGYPGSVFFNWDQQTDVGLQVVNTADEATTDPSTPTASQTPTDSFVLGQSFFLLGWPPLLQPTDFPNFIFQEPVSDVLFAGDDGYIQFWNNQLVAGGSSRTINAFYRSTWGDSLYGKPYSVVVDTPKVVNLSTTDANQFAQNPFTIRVWVDNNRGFSTIDQEIPLQDVQVQLLLPDGLTAVGGATKTINRIDARNQGFVDFTVQANDYAAGDLTYQVRITPTPGPQKTVTGTITVVSQPKLTLENDANLITSPWTFETPTWEAILGLTPDADYQAFFYDPVQKGYIVSTGPERGRGAWIVSKLGTMSFALGGNPTAPTDYKPTFDGSGGAPLVDLKPGWNLIGNPYHVSFQLGEIVGVSNSNPNQSYTYAQLVQQGIISGAFAYWDTGTQNYGYIQKTTDTVTPQKGYWVYVYASDDVFLRFPPIYKVGVRSEADNSGTWQQTAKQWRLQLAVRGKSTVDDQNFVGIASSSDNAKLLRVNEPPMAPIKGAVSLSVNKTINGQATKLAQSLSEVNGKQEFDLTVDTSTFADPTQPQTMTLTWPNLSTIPKNVRVRLVDVSNGQTRDLRKVSGYTFQATSNSTRAFKIQIEPGTVSKAIIGSVVVTGDSRAASGSLRVSYALSSDATTTVRILGATGKEVAILSSGRADQAGNNEVVWNLRDKANRAVAPGTYRAEIVAEGADGERVRKITPVIITR